MQGGRGFFEPAAVFDLSLSNDYSTLIGSVASVGLVTTRNWSSQPFGWLFLVNRTNILQRSEQTRIEQRLESGRYSGQTFEWMHMSLLLSKDELGSDYNYIPARILYKPRKEVGLDMRAFDTHFLECFFKSGHQIVRTGQIKVTFGIIRHFLPDHFGI